MKKPSINIPELKRVLAKLPEEILGRDSLLLALSIILSILVGLFVFYKYSFLPEEKEIKIIETPLAIKEEVLSQVLNALDQRKERFKQEELKNVSDPFWTRAIPLPTAPEQPEEVIGP